MGRLPLLSVFLLILSCPRGSAYEIIIDHYTSYYGQVCIDSCTKHSQSYYWCNTRHGWDYCSSSENTDYKGNACRKDHPCGKYGEDYYWCYTSSSLNWGYCGPVEPKTMIYISSTYQRTCVDDCVYSGSYFWCNTEEGWDYCSPTPDVTYKNEPCHPDHPCGTYGYSYSWCNTAESWDYCGDIRPGECSYDTTQEKQIPRNTIHCQRCDQGNRVNTTFYGERCPNDIVTGRSNLGAIRQLIARWDNTYLRSRPQSNLIFSKTHRIDLQGLVNIEGQRYYNLQIQINGPRPPGQSTTVSQIFIPVNNPVPNRYVRFAFTESNNNQSRIFVELTNIGPRTRYVTQRDCKVEPYEEYDQYSNVHDCTFNL